MSFPRVLILADDLTGAADTAASFAARGAKTLVTLGDPPWPCDADVLAIDADTRRRGPDEAAQEIARLVRKYAPLLDPPSISPVRDSFWLGRNVTEPRPTLRRKLP